MGQNFEDHLGFQPKTTFLYYFAHGFNYSLTLIIPLQMDHDMYTNQIPRAQKKKKSTEKVKKILKELDPQLYNQYKDLIDAIKGPKSAKLNCQGKRCSNENGNENGEDVISNSEDPEPVNE